MKHECIIRMQRIAWSTLRNPRNSSLKLIDWLELPEPYGKRSYCAMVIRTRNRVSDVRGYIVLIPTLQIHWWSSVRGSALHHYWNRLTRQCIRCESFIDIFRYHFQIVGRRGDSICILGILDSEVEDSMVSLGSRIIVTILVTVSWFVFIILYLAFFSGGLDWWQRAAVFLASGAIATGFIAVLWVKWAVH